MNITGTQNRQEVKTAVGAVDGRKVTPACSMLGAFAKSHFSSAIME
jgi:hypothetical protein